MTVLPLAYLPSAEYFAHLLRGGCVVDLGEHFVKLSLIHISEPTRPY